jgi:signal transduction histidine kinase/CheY-like chemotaxis protein
MSIRTRLLLIALAAALVPALLAGWRFVEERDREIAAAARRLPAIAGGIATDLVEKINGAEQLHYGLARARELDTFDRNACSAFLQGVREKYWQYTGILTINPDGRLFCDSLGTGRNLDLNDRDYFRRAKLAYDAVAIQPAFGRLTGVSVLQIAYPARTESGELKFVLLASLNLARMAQTHMQRLVVPGLEIVLMDHQGVVLASTAPSATETAGGELLKLAADHPQGGAAEVLGPNGEAQVWAVAHPGLTRDAGVFVMVGLPRSQLVAGANRRLAEDVALLAATAMLLFLGVWFLAELGIRRHVGTIGHMVKRLGSESGVRVPPPHPRGEFGTLMAVLNQTAESLERQRADIDELNQKLRESQRLESIGQLTGGVAHDFNNLLTVILGNSEILAEQLASQPRLAELAQMVVEAAGRGADLTQRLLAFARKQPLDPRPVDPRGLAADLVPMLRRTLGEHIEVELRPGTGHWHALVDAAQLEAALLNLGVNARDAMPEGGRLILEAADLSCDAAFVATRPGMQAGDYVRLAVSDSGCGIAPEHLGRVFEPFFTTKEKGKGTGLGLAMVYGFVKQSGGHVEIRSEPGRGTTVTLYLPRAVEEEARATASEAPRSAGGNETILMVEDDELVRRSAQGHLSELGYRVIEAHDGAQALEIVRRNAAIDLLFTDVVMPGMSGRELADAARTLRPHLRVLYTSGYSADAMVHHDRLDPGVQLLGKPYRRAELAQRIRAALDAQPG